jgi:hypothetical protein
MEIIYADTWKELTSKMIGYYHDHCHHHYTGKTNEIPDKYKQYITEDKEYCFLYNEDKPNK